MSDQPDPNSAADRLSRGERAMIGLWCVAFFGGALVGIFGAVIGTAISDHVGVRMMAVGGTSVAAALVVLAIVALVTLIQWIFEDGE